MATEGRSISLPYSTPNLETGNWDALAILTNFQHLARHITALQTGQLVPTGALIMMHSGSTCPDGYTKVTTPTLANRYLRINLSSGGATGGASTAVVTSAGAHTHTNSVPTSVTVVDNNGGGATVSVASSTHLHTITSAGAHTHTATIAPLFLDVILCQKD